MEKPKTTSLVNSIKTLIQDAQNNAVRAVNQERVLLYWNIGKHIVEEEQNGKEKADYGTYLIKTLAKELTKDSNCERTAFTIELDPISVAFTYRKRR